MNKIFVSIVALWMVVSVGLFIVGFLNTKSIVYVDNYKIYQEYNKKKLLEKEFEAVKQQQKMVLDSLKMEMEMVKRKSDGSGEGERKILQGEMEQIAIRYNNTLQSFESSNSGKSKQYNDQIWTELNDAVGEFGKAKGYDVVLGGNGSGSTMYVNEKMDVTKEAIKYVNNRYEGK